MGNGALLPVMFVHVQNETESSIDEDTDSIRQIVSHALWATYLAPGVPPATRTTLVQGSAPAAYMHWVVLAGFFALVLALLSGVLANPWRPFRSRCARQSLSEPLH